MALTKEVFEKSLEGLSEEKKSELLKYYDQLSNNDHLSTVIKERDDAKKKAKELEDSKAAAEAKALEEQGKYKDLYESTLKQLTEKDEQINTLLPLKDKYSAIETERKKELIDKLPEGKLREAAEKIGDLSLLKEHVEAVLETLGDNKGGSFSGRSGKSKLVIEGKKWGDFATEELERIKKETPNEYKRMYKEKFGRLPKE